MGDHGGHLADRQHARGGQQLLAVGQVTLLGLLTLGGVGQLQEDQAVRQGQARVMHSAAARLDDEGVRGPLAPRRRDRLGQAG